MTEKQPLACGPKAWPERATPVFLLVAALTLTYSSALVVPYGNMDDYSKLDAAHRRPGSLYAHGAIQGRPVAGIVDVLVLSRVPSVGALRYLRALSVAGVCFLGFMFFRSLVALGRSPGLSALAAFVTCTMPAFQVHASMSICYTQAWAAVGAGVAHGLAETACAAEQRWRKWTDATLAVLVLLLVLAIHQSAALVYWVFTAISWLGRRDAGRNWRPLVWKAGVAVAAFVPALALLLLGVAAHPEMASVGRSTFSTDLPGKLVWFVHHVLTRTLTFNTLFPGPRMAGLAAALIAAGLILYLRANGRRLAPDLLVVLALAPMCYLPNLVIREEWPSYRSQVALVSLFVMYGLFALEGWLTSAEGLLRAPGLRNAAFCTVLAATGLLSGLAAADHVTRYVVIPQWLELNLLRRQLNVPELAKARCIYFIRPAELQTAAPAVVMDEFGRASSYASWVPKPMVYLVLRELAPDKASLPVEVAPPDAPGEPPPGAVVVDMRRLAEYR